MYHFQEEALTALMIAATIYLLIKSWRELRK